MLAPVQAGYEFSALADTYAEAHWIATAGDEADAIDLGDIELTPLDTFTVLVVDETDAPTPDAEVLLTALGEPHAPTWGMQVAEAQIRAADRVLGVTDSAGRLAISLGSEESLMARKGGLVSRAARVGPSRRRDREVRLRLSAGCRLGARLSQSGESIPSLLLHAREISDVPCPVERIELDHAGRSSTALWPGRWELVLADGPVRFDLGSTRNAFLPAPFSHGPVIALIEIGDGEQERWIDMVPVDRGDQRTLRLVDAESGAAIPEALLWRRMHLALPGATPMWYSLMPLTHRSTGDGQLQIDDRTLSAPLATIERLVVAAPGRACRELGELLALPTDEPTIVALPRAPPRWVRVVDGVGRPPRRRVILREDASRAFPGIDVATDFPDDAGWIAFSWMGCDVSVALAGAGPIGVIAARDLATHDRVSIAAPPLGAIQVVLTRDTTPDLACRRLDPEAPPTLSSGMFYDDRLVFDDLPPGTYGVGPRAALLSSDAGGALVQTVSLADGEQAVLPWLDAWDPPHTVECWVEASGVALDRLFVVPLLGDPAAPFLGRVGPRFPVGHDGHAVLKHLGVTPNALIIARTDRVGDVVPLCVTRSGQTAVVRCGQLSVKVLGGDGPITVSYVPRIEGLAACAGTEQQAPESPILLDAVPVATRTILVRRGDREVEAPVLVVESRTLEIAVDLR